MPAAALGPELVLDRLAPLMPMVPPPWNDVTVPTSWCSRRLLWVRHRMNATGRLDEGVAAPPYLQPFVLSVAPAARHRLGNLDVYFPKGQAEAPCPVIVFVHGGPLPPDRRPTPRDWPVYVGYGCLAAASGAIGVTIDHRFHSVVDLATAADDVASAVEQARALPGATPRG